VTDLTGLRTVTVAALTALENGAQAGHKPPKKARQHRGRLDGQSSALKRLYTLREAATYLGIGYGKVRDYVSRGLLPAVKLPGGKLIHVTVDDLEHLVLAYREPGR